MGIGGQEDCRLFGQALWAGCFLAEGLRRGHTATWVAPVSTMYRGYQVWELPPPGQGIAALQMLNILSGYDLKKLGPTSADYWHLFVEAKKLAYADRARFYADPDFAELPTAELVSMAYADKRRRLIDMGKARTDQPAGDPKLATSDTIYLCAVDKDRNCVSFIQSNYHGFGSQPRCRANSASRCKIAATCSPWTTRILSPRLGPHKGLRSTRSSRRW